MVAPDESWMNRNTPFGLPARVAVVIVTGVEIEPPLVVVPTVASYAHTATFRLKISCYVPPPAPDSFGEDTTLATRAVVPPALMTPMPLFSVQVTARWTALCSPVAECSPV